MSHNKLRAFAANKFPRTSFSVGAVGRASVIIKLVNSGKTFRQACDAVFSASNRASYKLAKAYLEVNDGENAETSTDGNRISSEAAARIPEPSISIPAYGLLASAYSCFGEDQKD